MNRIHLTRVAPAPGAPAMHVHDPALSLTPFTGRGRARASRKARSDLSIVEATNDQLGEAQIEQMEALARRADPSLERDHIRRHHVRGAPARFYLVYADGRLQSMQSYATFTLPTPFAPGPLPVFRGYLTYKDPHCTDRQLTRRMSFRHVRRSLGPAWMLRRWVAVGHSPNPRVYSQFLRSAPEVYPRIDTGAPPEVVDFVRAVTGQQISPWLVDTGATHLPDRVDITETYGARYATQSAALDQFFFDLGMLERQSGRIHLTDRSMFIVCVHRPLATATHLLRQRLGLHTEHSA